MNKIIDNRWQWGECGKCKAKLSVQNEGVKFEDRDPIFRGNDDVLTYCKPCYRSLFSHE